MADVSRLIEQGQQQAEAGLISAAKLTLQRACASDPRNASAASMLSSVLVRAGELKPALYYAQRAAALAPENVGVRCDLAAIRIELGDMAGLTDLEALVAAHPQDLKASSTLVGALLATFRTADAEAACSAALTRYPHDTGLLRQLAAAQLELAMPEKALQTIASLRSLGEPDIDLLDFHALLTNYASLDAPGKGPNTPDGIYQIHRSLGNLIQSAGHEADRLAGLPPPARAVVRRRGEGEPIRVGFISAELRRHSVARFIEPLALHHDQSKLSLHAYSLSRVEDEVTRRLRPRFARWRSCAALGPNEIDAMIRRDQIDVAIELGSDAGTIGVACLRRRPAPVTGTYLGYPNTTGCPFIDLRLVDAVSDPPGSETRAVERLVRLERDGRPWPFLCYAPEPGLPAARARPSLDADGSPVVFGCYTAIPKVSQDTLRLWSAVLDAVPRSVLVVKSRAFADGATRARIESWWRENGVNTERLSLRPTHGPYLEHMDSYHDIHIALDPTPYNGTTTTCDALAMGTPVLALRGAVHAARVSASILEHSGLGELTVDSTEQYVALAAELAGDQAELAALHTRVRERFLGGPVCDGPGFCRAFEQTIERVLREAAKA